ncbi:hypothetical protein [Microvirga sp. BSC39]|uniref:hypothetical protein n=1 Tax=Microvirga sp. BSC39 TaxID=1549810 RepID=UPI0004E946ED|nr:hypothetical protein [Microvirga sp. BSC39]KFG70982.1 hypothetical protein JH26_00960 [Microvirga sp. BSC39]
MSNRREPAKPWTPKRFWFYVALLGLIAGIAHTYVHAFWRQPHNHSESEHILWSMLVYVVAGAALSAMIAAIRNWRMRQP